MVINYTTDSPLRLTKIEEKYLIKKFEEGLDKEKKSKSSWNKFYTEATKLPLYVDHGYNFSHNYSKVHIGINGLYEEIAKKQLINIHNTSKNFSCLLYPSATPKIHNLFLSCLYFDFVYVIHPGSAIDRDEKDRHRTKNVDSEYMNKLSEFYKRLDDFNKAILPLKQNGLLYAIPPQMQQQ